MADSGVDTSNESNDNFDIFALPEFTNDNSDKPADIFTTPNIFPQITWPYPFQFDYDDSSTHNFVGKVKRSTKARHHRLKCRHSGILYTSKNQKLLLAASTNNTELVKNLLESGVDPNASDEHQRSPLHLAACRGYTDVVKLLLCHGANPNNKDSLGNTPLHLAACVNNIPVISALLDAGTDVSANDRHGRNPIQIALSKLKLILTRPRSTTHVYMDGTTDNTTKLISEVWSIIEMMLKYMEMKKEETGDLELICDRLKKVNTHEEVECEVKNILDSFNSLQLQN